MAENDQILKDEDKKKYLKELQEKFKKNALSEEFNKLFNIAIQYCEEQGDYDYLKSIIKAIYSALDENQLQKRVEVFLLSRELPRLCFEHVKSLGVAADIRSLQKVILASGDLELYAKFLTIESVEINETNISKEEERKNYKDEWLGDTFIGNFSSAIEALDERDFKKFHEAQNEILDNYDDESNIYFATQIIGINDPDLRYEFEKHLDVVFERGKPQSVYDLAFECSKLLKQIAEDENNKFHSEYKPMLIEKIKQTQNLLIESKDAQWCLEFAINISQADVEALQRVVVKSGDADLCLKFAQEVKKNGVNIKKLQKVVCKKGTVSQLIDFAKVEGADIGAICNAIIRKAIFKPKDYGGDCLDFAKTYKDKGANVRVLEWIVKRSKKATDIYEFMKDVKNESLSTLEKFALRSKNPLVCLQFAEYAQEKNISVNLKALQKIVIRSKDSRWILQFAKNIKKADVVALGEALAKAGEDIHNRFFVGDNYDFLNAVWSGKIKTGDKKKDNEIKVAVLTNQGNVIYRSGNAEYCYKVVRDIIAKTPNSEKKAGIIKAFESKVIESKKSEWILKFAEDIEGADVAALSEALAKTGDVEANYDLLDSVWSGEIAADDKIKAAVLTNQGNVIYRSGNAEYCYNIVKNVIVKSPNSEKKADLINAFRKKVKDSENKEWKDKFDTDFPQETAPTQSSTAKPKTTQKPKNNVGRGGLA